MAVFKKYQNGIPPGAIYIGRGSPWGNPFVIGKDGDRATVIEKFRQYALANPELVRRMKAELAGKDLVCFCAPLACHGHIIEAIIRGEFDAEIGLARTVTAAPVTSAQAGLF